MYYIQKTAAVASFIFVSLIYYSTYHIVSKKTPSTLQHDLNPSISSIKLESEQKPQKQPQIAAQLQHNDIIYGPIPKRNTVPIVNEEYNVIFFQVAKSASTEWKRFFTRLQGNPNWCAEQSMIHKKHVNKLKLLSDFSLEEAQMMMTSPSWKKAVFVRHPKPRLLSAFLDKAVVHSEYFQSHYCAVYEKLHGGDLNDCILHHQNFEFFLQNFTATSVIKDDMHWRSIYSRIDEKWWPHIDFIGNMQNLNQDAQEFLSSIRSNIDNVTAWDRNGRTGWSDKKSKDCNVASKGEGPFLGVRDNSHMTKAREQMIKYYTPKLEVLIEERYADDLDNPYFSFSPLQLFEEEN
jgi:hypothetical protein